MAGFGSSRGGGGGHSGGGSFGSGHSGRSFGGSRSGGFGSSRSSGSFGSGGYQPPSNFGGGPVFGAPPPPMRPRPVYYSSGRVYRGSGTGRGMGCGSAAIVLVVIAFVLIFVLASSIGGIFAGGSGGDVTKSTVQREALPVGSVKVTDYYTDELGLISNKTEMERGLKYFLDKTGVQPYIFLTDNINGSHNPSDEELAAFSGNLYQSLFTDEAHVLVTFIWYNNDYNGYIECGNQAKTVFDDEAQDILLDNFARYIDYTDITYEEFFSMSFRDTADRMMEVTTSPWIPVLIVMGVVMLVVILFVWWRHAKKQKNLEAQQTEEMLKTPLDKFGDKEAEELGKKYDDDPNNDVKS